MTDATEIGMDELFSATTDELFKATVEEKVIKTGTYITRVAGYTRRRNADDAEYNPGRATASLNLVFFEEDGKTMVGNTFCSVSWEARYTANGKIDPQARRFVELYTATGAPEKNPGSVLEASLKIAFMSRVRETYVVSPDDLHSTHAGKVRADGKDSWVVLQPDDDEEREHYISLGYEPRTMVDRFFPIR